MPADRLPFRIVVVLGVVALLSAGCDGDNPPPSVSPTTHTGAPSPDDGYVPPYSPSPTPMQEVTNGFVGETLTLPTAGGGKVYVTIESTAMTLEPVNGARSLSVWMSLQNPGDQPWSGVPGGFMTITDEQGAEFPAVPTPIQADLHPDPGRYGYSNKDLHKRVTIQPGDTMQGVVVFRPVGGNRPIQIHMSLDKGTTFAIWLTNLGVF